MMGHNEEGSDPVNSFDRAEHYLIRNRSLVLGCLDGGQAPCLRLNLLLPFVTSATI